MDSMFLVFFCGFVFCTMFLCLFWSFGILFATGKDRRKRVVDEGGESFRGKPPFVVGLCVC